MTRTEIKLTDGGPRPFLTQLPSPGEGELVVATRAAAFSPGDLHAPTGLTICGEFSGEVVEVGSDVDRDLVGERVAVLGYRPCGACQRCADEQPNACSRLEQRGRTIDGGLTDAVLLDVDEVVRVPAGVSFEDAALMHRVAAAIHAWRRSGARPGDNAAILGGTPLALAMGAVALSAGSGRTALIDDDSACGAALAEHRAAAVATPNDDAGWDELRSALGGFGPDVVFECSGTPRSRLAAVELSRPAGSVVLLASDEQRVPMDLNLLVMGDKRVRGARGYAAAEAQAALELMARSCIDTSALVGASMEIDAFLVAAADDALASGLSSCQTTIVRWPADAQLPVTAQS